MELAVVAIIALIVFGPKKLPELGSSLGRGMREFKSSISGEDEHTHEEASVQRLEATSVTAGAHAAGPEPATATVKPADA